MRMRVAHKRLERESGESTSDFNQGTGRELTLSQPPDIKLSLAYISSVIPAKATKGSAKPGIQDFEAKTGSRLPPG